MTHDISKKLFEDFQEIPSQQWNDLVIKDLKGEDFEKKLVWAVTDEIKIKPYYRKEDLSDLQYLEAFQKHQSNLENKVNSNQWEIRQDIYIDDIISANNTAIDALKKGADAICFNTKNIEFNNQNEFSELLNNIDIESIAVHFLSGEKSWNILQLLSEEIKKQKLNKNKIKGSINYDFVGCLTTKGIFFTDEKSDISDLKKAIVFCKENLPEYKIISVCGNYLHNAGASVLQELAYSLNIGNEYLEKLTDEGLSPDDVLKQIHFTFATGSNYFLEIAKIRAARLLWTKIAESYHPILKDFLNPQIHSVTSTWNKTIYDPYVNVLRTTTESMSAIIGGTDSLTVKPFDLCYKKSDKFSERIARNQQVVLKEESYLHKVNDPSAGSYYIENLTHELVQHAWHLFLLVQEKGGYIKAFQEGIIQREISRVAHQRDINIAMKKEVLLGTNQHANQLEKESKNITLECYKKGKTKTQSVVPLVQYRGAAAFEELRLQTEQCKNIPKVFLLSFGNITMRKARAGFASNFFGCAGFHVIENAGCKTIEDGIAQSIKQKADITVLCSSDDEYELAVPIIYNALKSNTKVVLVGYPKALIDQFKTMGLQHFIYAGCNILETLQMFQKELRKYKI